MTFKPFPELKIEVINDETGELSIQTKSGATILKTTVYPNEDDINRLVDCWNVLRHVAFPAAHVKALENRVERLEGLRKEAWAMAEKLAVAAAVRDLPSEVRFVDSEATQ